MAILYVVLGVVLVAAVIAGSRTYISARKSQCQSCKRLWAITQMRVEELDEQHQLATEVCKYCQFTRRRIERIPDDASPEGSEG